VTSRRPADLARTQPICSPTDARLIDRLGRENVQLAWLVHHRDGARYFVSLAANDTRAGIDETPMLRTALGVFDLLASGE